MSDAVLDFMRANNIPITRERYINLAYNGEPPEEWTAEAEAELPPELQWDLRGRVPAEMAGFTIAEWASYFSKMDRERIDTALRSGLIAGLDNTEIARKVIGSLALNGIDGATEITRQEILRLARIAVSPKKTGEE